MGLAILKKSKLKDVNLSKLWYSPTLEYYMIIKKEVKVHGKMSITYH